MQSNMDNRAQSLHLPNDSTVPTEMHYFLQATAWWHNPKEGEDTKRIALSNHYIVCHLFMKQNI